MKNRVIKLTAIFFVLIFAFSGFSSITAFAAKEEEATTPVLVLSADRVTIERYESLQITATISGTDEEPLIAWVSSNESVAKVNGNGLVYGAGKGEATIYASATVGGKTIRGEFDIVVMAKDNLIRDFLVDHQVLSYQYSYEDDYYYTNDKEAWQYNFGFGRFYDIVSPYILLEYDYVRVFFTYEDKDWMLQMWKGQYGLIFYGGEIGIYNRPHSEDGVSEWAFYNCPAEEDWLGMEMTLWHEQSNGSWVREFTREYDKYWWCTGFKNGHLRVEEPADELRLEGRITFKDEEMAKIVAEGLTACGFKTAASKDEVGVDQIYVDGKDIKLCWQNINDAESTMAIKVIGGTMTAWTFITFLPLLVPYVVFFWGVFGLGAQLVSLVL